LVVETQTKGELVHTLLKVTMSDVAAANACLGEGKFEKIVKDVSNFIRPEARFFYAENGFRTALFIFDMKDTSQIPSIAEPFFTGLNARVEFFPAMNTEELSRGLQEWSKKESNHQSLS
jgi:hypothetical protein